MIKNSLGKSGSITVGDITNLVEYQSDYCPPGGNFTVSDDDNNWVDIPSLILPNVDIGPWIAAICAHSFWRNGTGGRGGLRLVGSSSGVIKSWGNIYFGATVTVSYPFKNNVVQSLKLQAKQNSGTADQLNSRFFQFYCQRRT